MGTAETLLIIDLLDQNWPWTKQQQINTNTSTIVPTTFTTDSSPPVRDFHFSLIICEYAISHVCICVQACVNPRACIYVNVNILVDAQSKQISSHGPRIKQQQITTNTPSTVLTTLQPTSSPSVSLKDPQQLTRGYHHQLGTPVEISLTTPQSSQFFITTPRIRSNPESLLSYLSSK